MNFKVGDIVLCINDTKTNPRIDLDFQNWVVKNEKYTIRATSMDLNGGYRVLLEEITNIPIWSNLLKGKFEPGFNANRFRKIETDKIEVEETVEEEIFA